MLLKGSSQGYFRIEDNVSAYNLQFIHAREGGWNGQGVPCDFYFITGIVTLYQTECVSVAGGDEVERISL